MPLDDIEKLILELVEVVTATPKYEAEETTDILLVMTDVPVAVVPVSERAKQLFVRWGMPESCQGIAPPDHPQDLIESIPFNWILEGCNLQEGLHKLAQITLPQPLVVVH